MNIFQKLLIYAAIVFGTGWFIWHQQKQIKDLTQDLSLKTINLKAAQRGVTSYQSKGGTLHSVVTQENATIADLKDSKDSVIMVLLDSVNKYKIKVNNLEQVGTVTSTLTKVNTIKYVPTTRDTTYDLSTLPFIEEKIHLKDDSLTRELKIFNKQTLLWSTHRETIDPPKKFFLFRWFQKRHNVTTTDIVNSNPYIETDDQRFLIITK
jgi:hypothetical protein